MKKAYLFSYTDAVGTQEHLGTLLNKLPEVSHWRYDLPNAFYLISTSDAKTLSGKIRTVTGGKGLFVIVEITANSYGWLTPESWHLIQHKEYKPKA